MASKAKKTVAGLEQVRISPEAYACLRRFMETLEIKIIRAATGRAQARVVDNHPGRVAIEDIVRSTQALLPIAVTDLENSLKQETTNVRHAS